jgi:hypothetical protein
VHALEIRKVVNNSQIKAILFMNGKAYKTFYTLGLCQHQH